MSLPRSLIADVRQLDEHQLRHLMILTRGLLQTADGPVMELDDIAGMPRVRFRQKTVKCNKPSCTRCPHGPYWYAEWSEGGKRRSTYLGTDLPADVRRKLESLERTTGTMAASSKRQLRVVPVE